MSDSTPRRPISKALRFAVLERDEFRCQYCGATPQNGALEVDHIIPASKGGETSADNLITSCEPCNKGKSNKHVEAAPIPDMEEMAEAYEAKRKAIEKWRREYNRMDEVIASAVREMRRAVSVPEHILASAIREYGVDEVAYAVEAIEKRGIRRDEYEGQTKYLYGVLRNRSGQGYEPRKKASVPRSNCPFDFGDCWIGADDASDYRGDVHGCVVHIEADGRKFYTGCRALIEYEGGWPESRDAGLLEFFECLEDLSDFAAAWRKSGTAAIDWLRKRGFQAGWAEGARHGRWDGMLEVLDADEDDVVTIRDRVLAYRRGDAE